MTHGKVTVLGINGHAGHHIGKAFAAGGWTVTGFGRSNRHPVAGVEFLKGDADIAADLAAAVAGADIVVNALHLPYHQWDQGRAEAQLQRVLTALGSSGQTLLFPGTIYNYAAADRHVAPDLPQHPEMPRGEIRKRLEQMLEAAAKRGDIQAIILRAGDFYGPENLNDWFDLAMLRDAKKGKFAMMGVRGIGHSWAFLPDLGRAFEKLAWHRKELGQFENFHFAGNFVTPEVMANAVLAAVPVPLKVSVFPRILFNLVGIVDPIMREIGKMAYLWENPMELADARLDAILGPGFATPFEKAIATTVTPFFAAEQLAA